MSHKYHIRQTVRLRRPGFSDGRIASASSYEVTLLMPSDETGEPAYRIKSGAVERAAREGEIALV
jgi:hypothetical protein